jgi:hypothetical protein
MSQLVDASEIRNLAAGIERQQRCTEMARDRVVRACATIHGSMPG